MLFNFLFEMMIINLTTTERNLKTFFFQFSLVEQVLGDSFVPNSLGNIIHFIIPDGLGQLF